MIEGSPLISLVLPTFNMSRHLDDCIRSMKRQRVEKWEAIFVDDGSTDDTLELLKKYSSEDPRIRYVHQQNGGVSKARNVGIKAAKGEWVWCVDPDDVLLADSLERVIGLAFSGGRDAVFFTELGPFEGVVDEQRHSSGTFSVIAESEGGGESLLLQERIVWGHPFMRVLKRELYLSCLYYEGTRYYEDSLQLIDTVCRVKHWVYVDAGVYGYRQREGSVCHGYKSGQCRGVMETTALMIQRVKARLPLTDDQFHYYFEHVLCGALRWYLYRALRNENEAERRELRSVYKSLVKVVGWSFANPCLKLRLLVGEMGLYRKTVGTLDFVEYLAGGISARARRVFAKK